MGVTFAAVQAPYPTGTGNIDITTPHLGGLTPKWAILISSLGGVTGTAVDNAGFNISFIDGSTDRTYNVEELHAAATSDANSYLNPNRAIEIANGAGAGTVIAYANDQPTFKANGMTINWTFAQAGPPSPLLTAIFGAGTDMLSYMGHTGIPPTTSPIVITDVPFEADAVIGLIASNASVNGFGSIGFIHNDRSGTVSQVSMLWRTRAARPTTDNQAFVGRGNFGGVLANTSATLAEYTAVSFNSKGFSINVTGSANAHNVVYLAMRFSTGTSQDPVIKSKAYIYTTPTTTGTFYDANPGWKPQAVFYLPSLISTLNVGNLGTESFSSGFSVLTSGSAFTHMVTSEDNLADSNTQSLTAAQPFNVPLLDGSTGIRSESRGFITTGVAFNYSANTTTARFFPAIAFQEYTAGTTPISVSLNTLRITGSAIDFTVVPGATSVPINTLRLTGSAIDFNVFSEVSIPLSTLRVTGSAIPFTVVPGAASILLDTLGITGSVIDFSVVPGAISVPLSSLRITGSAIPFSVSSEVSIPINTLRITGSAISFSVIPGTVSVPLSTLHLTGSAIDFSVVPGATTVPLSTLSITGSAIPLSVIPGAISVPLSTLHITGSAIPFSVTPGAVSIPLASLHITGSAIALSVSTGGATPIFIPLNTLGITGSAIPLSVSPGTVSVPLTTLGLTGSAIDFSVVPGATSVPLTTLRITGSAIQLTATLETFVALSTLHLTGSAPSLSILPGGTTVSINTLGITGSAINLSTFPGAISVPINTLGLTGSTPSLLVVPGTVFVALDTLGITGSAIGLSILPGATSLALDTLGLVARVPNLVVFVPSTSAPTKRIYHVGYENRVIAIERQEERHVGYENRTTHIDEVE